jgi:hypothetical protein
MMPGEILSGFYMDTGKNEMSRRREEFVENPKLLEPGWAGQPTPSEVAYIKVELLKSALLRQRWGFKRSTKRFSSARIRYVAEHGVPAKKKKI